MFAYIVNKSPWFNWFRELLAESPIAYRLARGVKEKGIISSINCKQNSITRKKDLPIPTTTSKAQ
jgi:hypothetical protein